MDADVTAYAEARAELLDAQRRLADARAAFAAAEEPLRADIEKAWGANRAAVEAAQRAGVEALEDLQRVEAEVGDAARKRSPDRPVLNKAERERVQEALDRIEQTKADQAAVVAVFKAGVTADQVMAVRGGG